MRKQTQTKRSKATQTCVILCEPQYGQNLYFASSFVLYIAHISFSNI